jgi:hypothetical protein
MGLRLRLLELLLLLMVLLLISSSHLGLQNLLLLGRHRVEMLLHLFACKPCQRVLLLLLLGVAWDYKVLIRVGVGVLGWGGEGSGVDTHHIHTHPTPAAIHHPMLWLLEHLLGVHRLLLVMMMMMTAYAIHQLSRVQRPPRTLLLLDHLGIKPSTHATSIRELVTIQVPSSPTLILVPERSQERRVDRGPRLLLGLGMELGLWVLLLDGKTVHCGLLFV